MLIIIAVATMIDTAICFPNFSNKKVVSKAKVKIINAAIESIKSSLIIVNIFFSKFLLESKSVKL